MGGFICLTFSPFIIVTLSFFRDFKRQMKTGILWARTKYGSVKAAGKYSQLNFHQINGNFAATVDVHSFGSAFFC